MKIGINEFLLHSFIELASCLVSRTEHSVKKAENKNDFSR